MTPINLRPHEARRLAEAGEVLAIRPSVHQPASVTQDGVVTFVTSPHGDSIAYPMEAVVHYYCPFGPPGSKAWGRETWQMHGLGYGKPASFARFLSREAFHYRADDDGRWKPYWGGWRPATQMPIEASRFPSLVVASVRLCRLWSLTESEAVEAGSKCPVCMFPKRLGGALSERQAYFNIWDVYHRREHPAAGDPWVWAALLRREG